MRVLRTGLGLLSMLRIAAVIIAIVLSAGSASAERRMALVIGEDDYKTVRKLDNAVADAQSVEATLEKLGFTVTLETDRNLKRLRRALEDFEEDADGADVALVYYAGHGVEVAGENRLLPTDADASSLEALKVSTLPLEDVRAAVARVSKVGLIILDACRNDPFGTAAADAASRGVVAIAQASEVKPGLGRIGRAEGILFAFSAAPGETAADGADGHSPFAAALAKYLATQGVEIRSALTLVQQEVYDRSRGKQLPYVENGLPKLFFAAESGDKLPERERLLLAMADVTPDQRSLVEQIAAENDMPLAPLYGALLERSGAALDADGTDKLLTAAAQNFVRVRGEMQALSAADPAVAKLRGEAEEQLSLGAFETAQGKLAEARALDRNARQTLKANLAERTLSEASTVYLAGGSEAARGRLEAAVEQYRAAVALYDELGASLPTAQDDMSRLNVLTALAEAEIERGAIGDALDVVEKLTNMAEAALRRSPDAIDIKLKLADAHVMTSDVWLALGAADQALQELDTAHGIAAQAVEGHPLQAGILVDILGRRAVASERSGQLEASVKDRFAQVDLMQEMTAAGAPPAALDRQISTVLIGTGDLLMRLRQTALAKDAYARAGAIRKTALDADPQSPRARFELGVARERYGDAELALGNLDSAEAEYQARHAIIADLAAAYPESTDFRNDLSVSYEKLGDIARARHQDSAAVDAYRASAAIMAELVRLRPDNAAWRSGDVVIRRKVGEMLMAAGDIKGAFAEYNAAMTIVAELAGKDPANRGWQNELATLYNRIGDMLLKSGNRDQALESYTRSIAVLVKLTEAGREPVLLSNLSLAYRQLASLGADPVANLERAVAILDKLEAGGMLDADNAGAPAAARKELEAARKAAP